MNRRVPNKDEVRGKYDEAAGTLKQHIARATGNPNLADEGSAQHWQPRVRDRQSPSQGQRRPR